MHVQDDILKKRVLWGTVTWSKMRQQNIHAKKVYSHDCAKKIVLTDACYLACSNGWEVNYYGWQTTDGDRCYNRADNFDICIEGKCRVRH